MAQGDRETVRDSPPQSRRPVGSAPESDPDAGSPELNAEAERIVYTIGHSNQSTEELITLLKQHAIQVLADVRSAPYSRYVPHFNARELKATVLAAGLQYVYLGKELGGRPDPDSGLYDADRRARYDRIAETTEFRQRIDRLKEGAARYRIAVMCSEENPTECHRRLLVGTVLMDEGIQVLHIRGDGRIDTDDALLPMQWRQPIQQSFLDNGVEDGKAVWRSARSVLRKDLPDSSSRS